MKYNADEFRNLVREASKYITCKKYAHTENCTCNRHGVPILKDTNDALRCAVEEAERLRGLFQSLNERYHTVSESFYEQKYTVDKLRKEIDDKEREITRLHEVGENARKAVLKQRWNDVLFLLNGDTEKHTEEELEREEFLFRLQMQKKEFVAEKLRKEIDEHHAILERIRFHAQKMVEWKGAPDPFGPLHGSGMVLCANAEGKRILKFLDGEVLSYSEQKTKEV